MNAAMNLTLVQIHQAELRAEAAEARLAARMKSARQEPAANAPTGKRRLFAAYFGRLQAASR
jgi:hypothetical protein